MTAGRSASLLSRRSTEPSLRPSTGNSIGPRLTDRLADGPDCRLDRGGRAGTRHGLLLPVWSLEQEARRPGEPELAGLGVGLRQLRVPAGALAVLVPFRDVGDPGALGHRLEERVGHVARVLLALV